MGRSRLSRGGEFDFLADGGDYGVDIGLVEATEDAFPTVSETAFGIVFAMLEKGVEGALAFAIVALHVEELGSEGFDVDLGEFNGIGQKRNAIVDGLGVMLGEIFERALVFAERATVVAVKDF